MALITIQVNVDVGDIVLTAIDGGLVFGAEVIVLLRRDVFVKISFETELSGSIVNFASSVS